MRLVNKKIDTSCPGTTITTYVMTNGPAVTYWLIDYSHDPMAKALVQVFMSNGRLNQRAISDKGLMAKAVEAAAGEVATPEEAAIIFMHRG